MDQITIKKRPRSEAVITQRKFFKKTARGKVIKGDSLARRSTSHLTRPSVLRERYLRDDVSCGIQGCIACHSPLGHTLPGAGAPHPSFANGHLILPDTNIFLSQVNSGHNSRLDGSDCSLFLLQMDIIESSLFTPPIIVLQTVLEEVRHRSLPLYNRLKALTKMDDKRIWVFYNEYRSYVDLQ
jgi:exosome complex exonuclease DIS3/RRP44